MTPPLALSAVTVRLVLEGVRGVSDVFATVSFMAAMAAEADGVNTAFVILPAGMPGDDAEMVAVASGPPV